MTSHEARKVAVIGAGAVGTACALYLQREGHTVTLIERDEPGMATSFGNAGGISPVSVAPTSMPGMAKNIPKWLLDPMGPLFLRWSYLPRATPWLIKYLRAGRRERVLEISKALYTLNGPTFDAYQPLLEDAGVEHLFHQTGQLTVYRTQASFEADAFTVELKSATPHKVEILSADEIRQLEPALAPIFERGVLIPDNGHCKNPGGLVQALAANFARRGGTVMTADVTGFEMGPRGPRKVRTSAGEVDVDATVIAAGAWSARLLRPLGYRVPLESQRGYHVTIEDPGVEPRIMCFPAENKFAITPMDMGLRLGGTAEIAGLDAPPDFARARVFLELGKRILPGLQTAKYTEWDGHRPCTPDSLPLLGAAPRHPDLYFAFGHGHQGLLGASNTGRVIAEVVSGRPPSIDLEPFRADRF